MKFRKTRRLIGFAELKNHRIAFYLEEFIKHCPEANLSFSSLSSHIGNCQSECGVMIVH